MIDSENYSFLLTMSNCKIVHSNCRTHLTDCLHSCLSLQVYLCTYVSKKDTTELFKEITLEFKLETLLFNDELVSTTDDRVLLTDVSDEVTLFIIDDMLATLPFRS